ncbi:helix-turn-helix domain-containing protein, partial [Candidatus Chrysopegis kryptomonas]
FSLFFYIPPKTKQVLKMTLGEALRQFRIKNDMSQKQVAFSLKISTEYYCKIENDKVIPSKNLLSKIYDRTELK